MEKLEILSMPKVLKRTQFGNPILRQVAEPLTKEQILSKQTQSFIGDMYYTLEKKKYGVGIAAPQLGKGIALSVISTKPTPTRPELIKQKLTIINPKIIVYYGKKTGMYEACISGTLLYGKAMRYKKIRLKWLDEKAVNHEEDFDGFMAHVIQHETDHLSGILYVDRVKDSKTYITQSEYKKLGQREK